MRIRRLACLVIVLSFVGSSGFAQGNEAWDYMLSKHMDKEGYVNYGQWAQDPSLLQDYLKQMAHTIPTESASKEERMAHWINLYNAGMMMMILDNYPFQSLQDIDNAWDRPVAQYKGKSISLNDIEDILIKTDDPRVHVALNCGAKSCPRLNDKAFSEENLDSELDQLMSEFINSGKYNVLDARQKVVISQIFEWHRNEFGKSDTDLIEYINKYSDFTVPENFNIEYRPYDWTLNDKY